MGPESVEEDGKVCVAATVFQVSFVVLIIFFACCQHLFFFFSYSYNPDANMGTLGFNGLPA